ncbi:MAG: tetratricopeptide repeat protein [Deltaproteobacteria bacterium]
MKKFTPVTPTSLGALLLFLSFPFCLALAQDAPQETYRKMALDYRDQGLAAQRTGDLDTALVYFQKAVELDPSLAVAYNDLGVLYEARGWDDRAKLAYGKAIELDPNMPSPYYNLGSIYAKEGDFEKAVKYFKQRVLVGEWNDEWTQKARRELKSLGVADPEIREEFMEEHLARVEDMGDIHARPIGNDLDPRTRKREARLRLFRGKQLSYMGKYVEALEELGYAEVLDPRNKEIEKTLEEVNRKALMSN